MNYATIIYQYIIGSYNIMNKKKFIIYGYYYYFNLY